LTHIKKEVERFNIKSTIWSSGSWWDRLGRGSYQLDLSKSEIIRRAVTDYLDSKAIERNPRSRYIGN